MRPDEFFETDDWYVGPGVAPIVFNEELVDQLRRGPVPPRSDIEVAIALTQLVDSELKVCGTSGDMQITNDQMRRALLSTRAVLARLDIPTTAITFRDFDTFRTWWVDNGAYGSWQGRRDLVNRLFDPIHNSLADMEQRALTSQLADPISPHQRTGWPDVDVEIGELRRHFNSARTPQDYRAVGLDCVAVLNAISAVAYDSAVHLRAGEVEPPVDYTKNRLERVVEDSSLGRANASLRKLARALIEFAQEVKHSETPSRRDAGIAADGVIQLANMMRRLSETA